MKDNRVWDILASEFDPGNEQNINPNVADNILIAEPVIIECLQSRIPRLNDLRVLDYGCGGGRFAHRLQQLGCEVDGIDSSPNMIEAARSHYGDAIHFMVGDAADVSPTAAYDVITSVMVLEFIPDVEATLQRLVGALKEEGLLVIATHNPDFVTAWAREGKDYVIESTGGKTKGIFDFGDGVKVPIFIRSADWYKGVIASLGMESFLEAYPPFTAEFLNTYPVDGPTEYSEYMILAFQK